MRPADDIEADLAVPPPDVTDMRALNAWLDRLEPGEVDDALMFRWLTGIAHASSGLVVSEEIASMPNLVWAARVVLAALQRTPDIAGPDAIATATALIFGHEDSSLRHIVEAGAVELIACGALHRTSAGGFAL